MSSGAAPPSKLATSTDASPWTGGDQKEFGLSTPRPGRPAGPGSSAARPRRASPIGSRPSPGAQHEPADAALPAFVVAVQDLYGEHPALLDRRGHRGVLRVVGVAEGGVPVADVVGRDVQVADHAAVVLRCTCGRRPDRGAGRRSTSPAGPPGPRRRCGSRSRSRCCRPRSPRSRGRRSPRPSGRRPRRSSRRGRSAGSSAAPAAAPPARRVRRRPRRARPTRTDFSVAAARISGGPGGGQRGYGHPVSHEL